MPITVPDVGKVLIGQALVDAKTYTVGLYTALANPITHTTIFADITEADYHGYAPQAVSGFAPSPPVAPDWVAIQQGTPLTWLATDNVVPNTILGAFYVWGAGELIGIEEFPTGPVLMDDAGKTFQTLPKTFTGSIVNNS